MPAAAAPSGRRLALEGGALLALVLTLTTWFGAWPRGLPPLLPAAAASALAGALMTGRLRSVRLPAPGAETLTCVALAVAYRAPALVHPWGWVNRDGAYGAFVGLHLLQGVRPAPVFTEGANYQGTLKAHLAALIAALTGARDFSLLMVVASLILYLVFLVAAMALARRLGGRTAALFSGLYLALSGRFLTVFSLNCVGQYVDVLALGGVALVLLARMPEDTGGAPARGRYLGIGLLLGAAFWQQPVALAYAAAALVALGLRRITWRDPWALLVAAGFLIGALPVLVWNAQHGWASGDLLGREPADLRAQADALPHLVRRTARIALPILSGLSPGHPWADVPGLALVCAGALPLALVGLSVRGRRDLGEAVRAGRIPAFLLPLLLALACLALFWATAAGRVYWRPRYLLPFLAAGAVALGVTLAGLARRAPVAAGALLAAALAVNVSGTLSRLREGGGIAEYYRAVVRSLEEKQVRNGYADFSISAPVTMFTAERIVLSPRLGPTPAYESESHARRVDAAGADAYVLRPEDDPEPFAEILRGLGVSYRLDLDPLPVFYGFSRPVRIDEIAGFRGTRATPAAGDE
jgi:hypothetical protein